MELSDKPLCNTIKVDDYFNITKFCIAFHQATICIVIAPIEGNFLILVVNMLMKLVSHQLYRLYLFVC